MCYQKADLTSIHAVINSLHKHGLLLSIIFSTVVIHDTKQAYCSIFSIFERILHPAVRDLLSAYQSDESIRLNTDFAQRFRSLR